MNEKVNLLRFFVEGDTHVRASRFREDLETAPVVYFIFNATLKKITYGNKAFCNLLRCSNDEISLMALSPSDIFCESETENEIHRILYGELPVRVFSRICKLHVGPDTRYGQVHFHAIDDGNPHIRYRVVVDDVHDLVVEAKESELTNELFRETESLLDFGTWNWIAATDTVKWTPGMYRLLGYDENDKSLPISNAFFMSHVREEHRKGLTDCIMEAIRIGSEFEYEYDLKTRSGEWKIISTKGKIVRDQSGKTVKVLGISRDVTRLRNTEREQERSLRELNRSNQELEEFAYIASHDLQEPLRKIAMFSERLSTRYQSQLEGEAIQYMDRIRASVDNMRTLIDNLLEFSRANRRNNTIEHISLEEILLRVLGTIDLKVEETKTHIVIEDSLPSIDAVPSEMEQLFFNLLVNAIKFRKPEQTPVIRITSRKASRKELDAFHLNYHQTFYAISVKDNGIGFEPEYADRIFQIFQRLHGKAEYPGSGIGLAICKKIIEKHRGAIFAKGSPGEGAEFTMILPVAQS